MIAHVMDMMCWSRLVWSCLVSSRVVQSEAKAKAVIGGRVEQGKGNRRGRTRLVVLQ